MRSLSAATNRKSPWLALYLDLLCINPCGRQPLICIPVLDTPSTIQWKRTWNMRMYATTGLKLGNHLQIRQSFACCSARPVLKIPMRNMCNDRWYTHRWLGQRDATEKNDNSDMAQASIGLIANDLNLPKVNLHQLNCWPPPKCWANRISRTLTPPGMCRSWRISHCTYEWKDHREKRITHTHKQTKA